MKRGRRSILNQKLQTEICRLLSQGSAIKSACIVVGVGERTYFDWRERGKAGEEPYVRFFAAVTRARETHKANLIERIVAATKADWKAASWLLERQFPDQFARSEPRTVVIEPPPPPPSPEPETPPKGMERFEKWLTPNGEGIPLDRESLNYLASLRQHIDPSPSPRPENGEAS